MTNSLVSGSACLTTTLPLPPQAASKRPVTKNTNSIIFERNIAASFLRFNLAVVAYIIASSVKVARQPPVCRVCYLFFLEQFERIVLGIKSVNGLRRQDGAGVGCLKGQEQGCLQASRFGANVEA